MEAEPAKLPSVQESILKRRRKRASDQAKSVRNNIRARRATQKHNRGKGFKPPDFFIKKYLAKEKDAKRVGNLSVHKFRPPGPAPSDPSSSAPSLVLAVRVKPAVGLDPNVAAALKLLRLVRPNTAVFLCLNPATHRLLRIAEPYVTWGRPNPRTVRELLYKRGHCRVDGRKMPLTSNELVESRLGDRDLICLDDLVHEIVTAGPNFAHCCAFLAPFRLNAPAGGWPRSGKLSFANGGAHGDRGEKINELLETMI